MKSITLSSSNKINLIAAASVFALASACSAEGLEETEPTAETSEAVTFAPAGTSSGQNGYSWSWAQNGPIATYMKPTTGWTCFLGQVWGRYAGSNDKLEVVGVSPGVFVLQGTQGNGSLGGTSFCVESPQTSAGSWSAGSNPTDLGSSNGRTCFLSRVQGNFGSYARYVRTRVSNGRWVLDGAGSGVSASARCVNRNSVAAGIASGNTVPLVTNFQSSTQYACGLQRIRGPYAQDNAWGGVHLTKWTTPTPRWVWYVTSFPSNPLISTAEPQANAICIE